MKKPLKLHTLCSVEVLQDTQDIAVGCFIKVFRKQILGRNALGRFLPNIGFCLISGVLKIRNLLVLKGLQPYAESLCRLGRKHLFLPKILPKRNAVKCCSVMGSDFRQIRQTNLPLKGVNPRLHNAGFYPSGISGSAADLQKLL